MSLLIFVVSYACTCARLKANCQRGQETRGPVITQDCLCCLLHPQQRYTVCPSVTTDKKSAHASSHTKCDTLLQCASKTGVKRACQYKAAEPLQRVEIMQKRSWQRGETSSLMSHLVEPAEVSGWPKQPKRPKWNSDAAVWAILHDSG